MTRNSDKVEKRKKKEKKHAAMEGREGQFGEPLRVEGDVKTHGQNGYMLQSHFRAPGSACTEMRAEFAVTPVPNTAEGKSRKGVTPKSRPGNKSIGSR